jgi:hypothetical protein
MKHVLWLVALAACSRSAASNSSAAMDKVELPKIVSGLRNPGAPEVIVTPDSVVVADKVVAKVANGALAEPIKLDPARVTLDSPLVIAFDQRTTGAAVIAVLDAVGQSSAHLTLLGRVVHETVGLPADYGSRANERADALNVDLHHDKAELNARDGTRTALVMKPDDPIDESVKLGMAVGDWKDAHAGSSVDPQTLTLTLTLYPDTTAADLLMAIESLREQLPRFVIVPPR